MVSYSQLLNMDFGKLSGAAEASGEIAKTLSDNGTDVFGVSRIPADTWDGADATAAVDLLLKQPDPLYDASDAFRKCRAALDELVSELESAKKLLAEAQDVVAGTGITIDGSGNVHTPVTTDPIEAARNEQLALIARTLIDDGVLMANTADGTASTVIGNNDASVKLASSGDIPGDDASARDVEDWWTSLSGAEQQAYIKEHPGKIGNLNGVASADRHEANMVTLREAAAGGNEDAAKLLDRIETSWEPGGDVNDRLHLIGLEDVDSDDAKVIAALGDPDSAAHTGVYVPGTTTDMGSLGSSFDNMDRLQDAAGEGDTSTVVWLGYDAPDHIPAAALPGYSLDGAGDLRDYTQSLDVTNNVDDSNLTVIGHSYGSTVVGTADAGGDGLGADDVVAVGSPGMGYESPERQGFIDSPLVDDTSDMHTPGDHVWVGANSDDFVTYLNAHGPDPSARSFDAERFATDGASGHSEYFDNGTKSLDNIATIVNGDYDVEYVARRFG
ncbi:MAG TPA: alpha/beta hydrolase family protein [Candidatus Stackebrandtia faecavium]|nr:alpha/beta hydrolase family protein [Candidatus Stackebrandtia faecavium]